MSASEPSEPAPRPWSAALTDVLGIAAEASTLTLATTSPRRLAQAAPLFFAAEADGALLFVSDPESRHSLNISATGSAAVAFHRETWDWREIAGVQMEGSVRAIPPGPERAAAWKTYEAKFPFAAAFEEVVARSLVYRFTPRWVRLVDNRVRFGHREEFTPGEA